MLHKTLIPLLIVAATLRLFSFNWGAPPQVAYADELYHAEQAVQIFDDPHRIFHEPYTPLFNRVTNLCLLPLYLYNKGIDSNPEAYVFYLGRILSALFDVLSIAATFILSTLLFSRLTIALFASAMHIVSFEFIRHSHYMTPDTLSVLLSTTTLLALYYYKSNKSYKYLLCAALLAAMATATKFNNIVLIVAALPLILNKKLLGLFLFSFVILLLVFFPALPVFVKGVLLANSEVATGTIKAFKLSCEGGLFTIFTHNYQIPHEELAARSVWSAMGILPAIISIVGTIYMLIKRTKVTMPLMLFIVLSLYPAARTNIIRYAMPAFPIMGILGAAFLSDIVSKLTIKSTTIKRVAFPILTALIILPSFMKAVQFNYLMSHQDSRVIAGEWIKKNIPKSSTVALFKNAFWSNPSIDLADYRVIDIPLVLYTKDGLEKDRARPLQYYKDLGVEYIAVNSFMINHHLNEVSKKTFPETVTSFEAFYLELDEKCDKVFIYEKNNFNRPGPSIKIYKI